MTFEFFGSIVIAPMDWTGCLSKTGFEGRAAMARLPPAAAGGAYVDRQTLPLLHCVKRRHAPAHRRRADVARAQTGDRLRIHFDRGRLRQRAAAQRRAK